MAEMTSSNDIPYRSSVTMSAKRALPNVSSGWVVMLLSGLLAMVIFFVAAGAGGDQHTIAVIGRHIEPGEPITGNALREAKVDAEGEQLSRMVAFDDRGDIEGWIATAPMEPGDVVIKSSLRKPAASDGRRAMSIPVDRSHAVDGDLRSGDRIDVIDANVTPAAYIAQGIEVLSVNNSGGSSLGGGSGDFSITVAIDAQTAIALSNTIKGSKFDIVRSTGAAPAPVTTTTTTSTP